MAMTPTIVTEAPQPIGAPPSAPPSGPVDVTVTATQPPPRPQPTPTTTSDAPTPIQPNSLEGLSPAVRAVLDRQFHQSAQALNGHSAPNPDADIDYRSGVGFGPRVILQTTDKPEEQAKELENMGFKPGDYGQDSKGKWWVKKDGKRVAVMPSKGIINSAENIAAGGIASSPWVAGSLVGAAAGASYGASLGPMGMLGAAAIGAGIGGATGAGSQDFINAWRGINSKTADEEAAKLANAGATSAIGEVAGPAIGNAFKSGANAVRKFWDVSPEISSRSERLLAEGAVPPKYNATPGAKVMGYHEQFNNRVVGDLIADKNTKWVETKGRELLGRAGLGPREIDEFLSRKAEGGGISDSEVGEAMVGVARQHADALRTLAEDAHTHAASLIRMDENVLRNWSRERPTDPRLAEAVGRRYSQLRTDVSNHYSQAYAQADQMVGRPIVSTFPLQQEAQRIVNAADDIANVPMIIRNMAQIDTEATPFWTLSQAHARRSDLRTILREQRNMNPNINWHHVSQMEDVTNATLQQAGTASGYSQELNALDHGYRQAIAPFNNADLNRIVQDARDNMHMTPEALSDLVLDPKNLDQGRQLVSMMTPDQRGEFARVTTRNVLEKASRPNAAGDMTIDSGKLEALLHPETPEGKAMAVAIPAPLLNRMRTLSRQLNAAGGNLDALHSLEPSEITRALEARIAHENELRDFVTRNPIQALLANNDTELFEKALSMMMKPGAETTTRAYADFLSTQPAGEAVLERMRQRGTANLLQDAFSLDGGGHLSFNQGSITNALKGYTKAQEDIIWPGGLADDFREFEKNAQFLTSNKKMGGGGTMAAGLAAGAFLAKVGPAHPKILLAYGGIQALARVMASPGFVRFLTQYQKSSGYSEMGMGKILSRIALGQATIGDEGKKPDEQGLKAIDKVGAGMDAAAQWTKQGIEALQ